MIAAWVGQELPVGEVRHLPLPAGIRNLSVDLCGQQERVLADRVQLQDACEPELDAVVVELQEWNADAWLVVERLEVQRQRLGERDCITQTGDAKHACRGGDGERLGLGAGAGQHQAQCHLGGEPGGKQAEHRPGYDRETSLCHRSAALREVGAAQRRHRFLR
jgi:hypothetical protein